MQKKIFIKDKDNPILSTKDIPGEIMYILNPGVTRYKGEYIMMMDAATTAGPIVFWLARSKDGKRFEVAPEPLQNWPGTKADYFESCVYDPRITRFEDEYLIMFASSSIDSHTCLGLVKTKDFINFELIEQAKEERPIRNGIIFPEKINGRYARLDRPMIGDFERSDMWISYSHDLTHWNDSKPVMAPRPGAWDRYKIGGGAVPIKTDKGWLEIYHGVGDTCNGYIYCLGVVLLDYEDPSKVIARSEDAVLWPEHDYELNGRVPNVVFTCNALLDEEDNVKIYYGAADTCIGLAEAKLEDLIDVCMSPNSYLMDFFSKKLQ